jgi:hypothetical protein
VGGWAGVCSSRVGDLAPTGVLCRQPVTGVSFLSVTRVGVCDWPETGERVVAGVFEFCGIGDCFAWRVALMLDSNFNLTRI